MNTVNMVNNGGRVAKSVLDNNLFERRKRKSQVTEVFDSL